MPDRILLRPSMASDLRVSKASLERRADYNYSFRRRFVSHGLSEKKMRDTKPAVLYSRLCSFV